MRIDSHQHFWNFNPKQHDWIDDSMTILKRNFLPNDLKPLLDQNGIDACIAVQADQSEEETKFLLDIAEQYDFVKGVVGWVDLCAVNAEKRLAFYHENDYFKGVRHIAQSEKKDFLLRADFQNGIKKLSGLNLTYDILIFPYQLDAAIELVKKFPDQKFVLDHLAKPSIKNQKITDWKKAIHQIGHLPNVSCKISGLVTEADITDWKSKDFTPYLDPVFEVFGEDRVLFGSDWPVCLLAANYDKVFNLVADYTAGFSDDAKEKLFGGNGARIYNITT
jgi:L-fuconolactonase